MSKIEAERKKIEELDQQIAKYQERILDQKSRLGGVNSAITNNQLIQKQIRVLENRLDKSLLKFNETLGQNKELRQRIDEYRRERVVIDVIYKKLERELHEKKKEMGAIIEDSKNAYQVRDKAQSEMFALQQHADKERKLFDCEFKDLGDLIKQQQATIELQRLKHLERTKEEKISSFSISDEGSGDHSQTMTNWNNNGNNNKDKNIPLSQEKTHSYEEALLKIQESTGIFIIDEIVKRFQDAEEQNFSLFNYVNNTNSEIEKKEHEISELRNQMEKNRGKGMSADTQRKRLLDEEKLLRTEKKAEEYEARYQLAVRTITQLKNGIQSIFTRIGAGTTSVDEILGNQGVTESNMIQYLGIIEQRTSEILQGYAASQIGLPNEQTVQLPSVVAVEASQKISVHPPSYDDMSSSDEGEEEDERPLTRHELEKRTLKEFTRRGVYSAPAPPVSAAPHGKREY